MEPVSWFVPVVAMFCGIVTPPVAWDQAGITCECDLDALCRHHDRCKQAEGWRLKQPEPGVFV
jgi:hypothetical protein